MASLTASVVIPAYNAAAFIGQCLEGLAKQTMPREAFEIIVVDDGSTDNTLALCEEFGQKLGLSSLRTFTQANAGPGPARNHGIRKAQAEIIVFLDSDCVPRPDWLENITQPVLEDPALMGVEGQTVPGPGKFTPLKHYVENRVGGLWWTCNIAYRKSVLYKVGGFDEAFRPACEDMDLGYRVNKIGKILFLPAAEVEHVLIDWPLTKHFQRSRTVPSLIQFWKKHPGFLIPEPSTFWDLMILQFKHMTFPWIRLSNWLFKDPWVFFKMSIMFIVWNVEALWRLPEYYRISKKPLVVKEPLHDEVPA